MRYLYKQFTQGTLVLTVRPLLEYGPLAVFFVRELIKIDLPQCSRLSLPPSLPSGELSVSS